MIPIGSFTDDLQHNIDFGRSLDAAVDRFRHHQDGLYAPDMEPARITVQGKIMVIVEIKEVNDYFAALT